MTAAGHGFGTSLKKGANEVAELDSIGGIETTIAFADASSHQSANAFEEIVAGMLKASPVPITGSFIPGDANGQITLLTDHYARTLVAYVITLPAAFGTTMSFNAYVGKVKVGDEPINGKIPFSAELAITGKPVISITASNNATALTCDDDTGAAVLAPVFAAATYGYVVTMGAAAVTYHLHVTFAAGICTITDGNGGIHTPLSTVATGEIAVTADSYHVTTVSVKETGKMAKTYTLYMLRP